MLCLPRGAGHVPRERCSLCEPIACLGAGGP
ncbi:hypothetical protein [Stenotrophomonas nematodicola]|uniref:Uncharacterized protein n=1 Tax=Stenotrophomonas nematodicola TaxID=2656746 RepID=A0ABW7CXI5_9GAMM